MERNRSGKIIAVAALVVAVAGLSLGFAAYSTSLRIETKASVQPANDNNWKVGFSINGTTIQDVNTAGTKTGTNADNALSGGSIDVTKYTISQTENANAVLKTENGSYVTYSLSILNDGTIPAYLDGVDFSNVTLRCANASSSTLTRYEGEEGAGSYHGGGNTTEISDTDCAKMFGLSLTIDETEYSPSYSGSYGNKLNAGDSVPVTLKLAYKGDTAADNVAKTLDGDIIVTAGNISVVYVSTNPNG